MKLKASIFRFGPYQFGRAQQELRRRDRRLPLPASQLKLLTLFLTRRGQLIPREEIALTLWADKNTVDVEMGINAAVRRLRAQLGDESASPTYIETIIGIGYRFIAEVEEIAEAEKIAEAAEVGQIGSLPEAVGLASQRQPDTGLNERPMVATWAEARVETLRPRLAAPGEVAIDAASAEVGNETLRSETSGLRRSRFPWRTALVSASIPALVLVLILGAMIAKWRHRLVTSASTRQETRFFSRPPLQITFDNEEDRMTAEAISQDGKSVAYSDRSGVSIHAIDSGSDRLLASPALFTAERLAWYPDERNLLVSGTGAAGHRRQVWVVSLEGDPPRLLLDDAGLAVPSPDGTRVAYTRKQDTEIWVADADGKNAHALVAARNGDSFTFLLWSPDSHRLVDDRHSSLPPPRSDSSSTVAYPFDKLDTQNRWTYESVDAATGKMLAQQENIRFDSAFLLRDGRLFYPVNGEPGESSLMMARTDPQSGRFLSSPEPPVSAPDWGASRVDTAISVSASASGDQVGAVLERRMADVYFGELRFPGPTLAGITRLTGHSQSNFPHAWTPNGDAVIFDNSNSGGSTVSKQRLGDAQMEVKAQLPEKAAMAEFTPDGKWMMFMEFTGWPSRAIGVFSVPSGGGKPQQLHVTGAIDEFHCPVASTGTCVMRETMGNKQFVFYALDPVQGMGQELGRMDWEPTTLGDWSISPDSTTVAMANHDPVHPSIQLVSLSSPSTARTSERTPVRTSTIPVLGFGTILEPTWSPDGKASSHRGSPVFTPGTRLRSIRFCLLPS